MLPPSLVAMPTANWDPDCALLLFSLRPPRDDDEELVDDEPPVAPSVLDWPKLLEEGEAMLPIMASKLELRSPLEPSSDNLLVPLAGALPFERVPVSDAEFAFNESPPAEFGAENMELQ